MKAIVCGAGLQGVPVVHALLKLQLEVSIVEPSQENVNKAREKLKKANPDASKNHKFLFYKNLESVPVDGVDFVFSAAPYHQNVKIAEWALSNKLPYFDLGGDPDTRRQISEKAQKYKTYTVTDLGLAPGLVNIVAEHMAYELLKAGGEVTDVYMRVGGLPVDPIGFLNYKRTWSTHGLRNEYSGPCKCLKYKDKTTALALTEVERVECFPELGILECFHTKGGLSHSLDDLWNLGVVNCNYKTLRWPGHSDALRFLLEQCKLEEETFDKAIENACPETNEDQVLLMAQVNNELFTMIIKHDENWTAMQIATAFPAAAAAFTIVNAPEDASETKDASETNYSHTYRGISKYNYNEFVEALCNVDAAKFAALNKE